METGKANQGRRILGDLSIGALAGVDQVLMCLAFTAMLFGGALASFAGPALILFLVGNAIIALTVTLMSGLPINLATAQEKAPAIMAGSSVVLALQAGMPASAAQAALSLIIIVALTTVLFGITLLGVARYDLGRMMQYIPFPVVCGFLLGAGWLLFGAGLLIQTGMPLTWDNLPTLLSADVMIHWLPSVAIAAVLFVMIRRVPGSLTLPLAIALIIIAFYLITAWLGLTPEALQQQGWTFASGASGGGSFRALLTVSPDWALIGHAIPVVLNVTFISLITAMMNLTVIDAVVSERLDQRREIKALGVANVLGGLVGGLPGHSRMGYTLIAHRAGVTTRWVGLSAASLSLAAVAVDFAIWVPKLVIATIVMLIVLEFFNDWLVRQLGALGWVDSAIVLMILAVIVFYGFLPGIGFGLLVTSVLFVVRYSRVPPIRRVETLAGRGSPLQRSPQDQRLLMQMGRGVMIYSLRGYLFFGSISRVCGSVQHDVEARGGEVTDVVIDFQHTHGADVSTVIALRQLLQFLRNKGVSLTLAGLDWDVRVLFEKRLGSEASVHWATTVDAAAEGLEETLLARHRNAPLVPEVGANHAATAHQAVSEFLGLNDDDDGLHALIDKLGSRSFRDGDVIFRQGDADSGVLLITAGRIDIVRAGPTGSAATRLRSFLAGATVGEMAYYLGHRRRTATAVAKGRTTVCFLSLPILRGLAGNADEAAELEIAFHRAMAKVLAERLEFQSARAAALVGQ